jgi:glycosyltransferase involved in cell wall biosynthesis
MKKSFRLPLVSIITPTRNAARFIEENILSIKAQTYDHVEHIVVDGCSTDGTLDIIKRYKNIKLLQEPDKGMYDAINKGIKLSNGEIISYLNNDDLYFPDTVRTAVDNFLSFPRIELIYGNCCFIDEKGKLLFKYRYLPFNWNNFLRRRESPICQASAFWRKKIHDKYGYFDPSFKLSGDYDFFMRVGSGKLVRNCGKYMAKVRIHSQTASSKRKDELARERKRVRETWAGICPTHGYAILWLLVRMKLKNWRAIVKKIWLRYIRKTI